MSSLPASKAYAHWGLTIRRCEGGPCFSADPAGASPAASMELLREAPLGIFCSCTAATLPYAAIPLAAHEVIELPDAPGVLQVGGSSNKLHLLLGDYIAVYKGRPDPILMYGFPEECESKQLNIGCSVFFLSLFLSIY